MLEHEFRENDYCDCENDTYSLMESKMIAVIKSLHETPMKTLILFSNCV